MQKGLISSRPWGITEGVPELMSKELRKHTMQRSGSVGGACRNMMSEAHLWLIGHVNGLQPITCCLVTTTVLSRRVKGHALPPTPPFLGHTLFSSSGSVQLLQSAGRRAEVKSRRERRSKAEAVSAVTESLF
ncbi:hypothetical protein SKAU_G00054560 [Synaphobranchus kaupii]|uniref:Uncharacterized protein n=1 Tax=Synaphobranchus kaupii TaxID=118154 RepID=A0A9Q1G456_SYNKA|nr:hypothetical protein SKAU_G00054560 [Synaphobranchus kaupii]